MEWKRDLIEERAIAYALAQTASQKIDLLGRSAHALGKRCGSGIMKHWALATALKAVMLQKDV